MRSLLVAFAVALLVSLFLAMTWTPTLSQYFLRDKRKDASAAESTADNIDPAAFFAVPFF